MKLISKRLRIMMLFIAVAALNAHMIIPHDHHQDESFNIQYESGPSSQNEKSHHHGLPFHCHACNDLAAEKAINITLIRQIQCKYIPVDCSFDSEVVKLQFSSVIYNEFTLVYPNSEFRVLTLLRAPPSLV